MQSLHTGPSAKLIETLRRQSDESKCSVILRLLLCFATTPTDPCAEGTKNLLFQSLA